MEKNTKIIIAIVIIILAIIGGFLVYNNLNQKGSTHFDCDFISGDFVGTNVIKNNKVNNSWSISYYDHDKDIEYNISTCQNSSVLIDYLSIQGLKGPENRHIGDNDWKIYYSQAVPNTANSNNTTTNTTNTTNNIKTNDGTLNIYICECTKNNQSYLIYIIAQANCTVKADGSTYCDLYKDYIVPLLESIDLKKSDAPSGSEALGISESQYTTLQQQLAQYKKAYGL